MRLTGGEARGRRIRGPDGPELRPTSDRVRQALFNVLGDRVRGAGFVDAYAGTGAIGIEALSRGARRVLFLERGRKARRLIAGNLRVGTWSGAGAIIGGDVAPALTRLARRDERFDIVFLDPPYDLPGLSGVLLAAFAITMPDGILVVEHRRGEMPDPGVPVEGRRVRTYRHGDTALSFWVPALPPQT